MIEARAIDGLRRRLKGTLVGPTDPDYESLRRVWNGMVDKRPALIARCAIVEDVIACVEFAAAQQVPIAARGGGHNFAGITLCEEGVTVDLSLMKSIEIDPERRTARADAGLKLGEFDRETQKHGLATTLGVATTTGISGLTLGGGYGWLAGKHGLACDNLLSAQIVTADGRFLTCSAEQNPDLFWALRGAGANFGIVTQLEYRLHPLDGVLGGPILHPLGENVFRFYDEFARAAPDDLTTLGAAMVGPDGIPAFATLVCWCGSVEEGERVLEPLRKFGAPIADLIQRRPYLEMQALFDAANPPGRRYYNKAHNVSVLQDGAIDAMLRYGRQLRVPGSGAALQQLHGAASRVPPAATAFPHRHDHYVLWISPICDDPAADEPMMRAARECWEELEPFVERSVYVNALDDTDEDGEGRVREAYGANYERLRELKRKYDPGNLFRRNLNIPP